MTNSIILVRLLEPGHVVVGSWEQAVERLAPTWRPQRSLIPDGTVGRSRNGIGPT